MGQFPETNNRQLGTSHPGDALRNSGPVLAQLLRAGDRIDGVTVTDVTDDGLHLEDGQTLPRDTPDHL